MSKARDFADAYKQGYASSLGGEVGTSLVNAGLWLWPWEECGEFFYGYMAPGQISGMDFSIARQCNYPKGHRGSCDWVQIYPAGFFPLRENRSEKRTRIMRERRAQRFPAAS